MIFTFSKIKDKIKIPHSFTIFIIVIYLSTYFYLFQDHYIAKSNYLYIHLYIQGGPKKSLWIDLEEKCLRNSKMFVDGVFLSIHIFTSCQEVRALYSYVEKKLWGIKNQPINSNHYNFFPITFKNMFAKKELSVHIYI